MNGSAGWGMPDNGGLSMKRRTKIWAAICAVFLVLSLAACSPDVPEESAPTPSPAESSTETIETEPSSSPELSEPEETAETVSPIPSEETSVPTVYMTTDISPDGLMAVYEALNREATGKVAVKISTGEPGSHYLDADLIADLVQSVDGTIVECNTAYGGSWASTAYHMQLAADHGYTAIADVDIMDANGSVSLPVEGGIRLTENLVGESYEDYDFFIILSHFKGHRMGGFGGAIKNMSVGIASSAGKCLIHSAGASTTDRLLNTTPQDDFLEAMAEAAKSVADDKGENILYINVMNHLSVDCDCVAYGAEPSMEDIGILASIDPVALDQACVDLVYAAPDGADLIERMESRNAIHALEHADAIGFGSREYELVSIDEE